MMKKRKLLILILSAVAIALEALPYGAVCVFANPEGEDFRRLFSYFDLTPYGYANFGPFITALLTCVLFALALVCLFKNGEKLTKAVIGVSVTAALVSLTPLLYGIRFFSVTGAAISAVLVALAIISAVRRKK